MVSLIDKVSGSDVSVGSFSLPSHRPSGSDKESEHFFSRLLPKAPPLPKQPGYYLVYKVAPGYRRVSVSYEISPSLHFLDASA